VTIEKASLYASHPLEYYTNPPVEAPKIKLYKKIAVFCVAFISTTGTICKIVI
jgi:hypothetical protein